VRSGLLLLAFASSLRAATITGEVIDTFCYAKIGIRGPAHAACGIKCARAGVPVGLLEEKTRRIYILLAPKDASPLPPALIEQMGRNVVVEGDPVTKGGAAFFVVRSFRALTR
jgi:hypothetical protein